MLPRLKEISRLKEKYMDERKKVLASKVVSLQRKLYAELLDKVISNLDTIEGSLKPTEANIAKASAIDRIFRKFEGDITKVMQQVLLDYQGIFNYNVRYHQQFNSELFETAKAKTDKRMAETIGITDRGRVVEGGFIDNFIKNKDVAFRVKQAVLNGVTNGMPLKDLTKTLNITIQGTDKVSGAIESQFRTYIYDTYSQYDRQSDNQFATLLDLNYAVYAGGLVDDSRPFCKQRNGKVFTRDEVQAFGTSRDKFGGYTNKSEGAFQGKPKNYIPERDMGGYNCGHTYNWITYELAKQIRPDIPKYKP